MSLSRACLSTRRQHNRQDRIRAKCLRLYAEHGLDLVIVDHMHLMQPDRRSKQPVLEYG